jgi:hypothetical protein
MTDKSRYEITVLQFATLLGLEHQHMMETWIHTDRTLRKEEMLFMYAPRVVANPPSTQNFMPELNTLHFLF